MICACLITRLPTEMPSLRPTTLKPSRSGLTEDRSPIPVRGLIVRLRTGNRSRHTVLVSSATTSIADMIGRIDQVVVDYANPRVLAQFWSAVLGGAPRARDESWHYVDPPGWTRLAFQKVPEGKIVKNRLTSTSACQTSLQLPGRPRCLVPNG